MGHEFAVNNMVHFYGSESRFAMTIRMPDRDPRSENRNITNRQSFIVLATNMTQGQTVGDGRTPL